MSLAQTVEAYLSARGIAYSMRTHPASTSSLDSAHAAHVDQDCVAKSVVLQDEAGFVLAVLPASRRLELERLRDELGRSLHVSEENDTRPLFPDCVLGAIPPVGNAYGLTTVLDSSLEDREAVFFEGGDHETLVCVDGDAFVDLLAPASVAEIAIEAPSLSAAIIVRERLHEDLLALSRAIAAPVASGTRWWRRVARRLERVEASLEAHIAETEGQGGVLREIVDQAPRLWRKVDGLEREHKELADECARIAKVVPAGASALALRDRIHDLLARFERHRHRGADLAFEAFAVDIGGG